MVSGTVLMYQTILRSFWDLNLYLDDPSFPPDQVKVVLSQLQWDLIDEVEAVVRRTQVLSVALQTPGSLVIAPLLISFVKFSLPILSGKLIDVMATKKGRGAMKRRAVGNGLPKLPKLDKDLADCQEPTQILVLRLRKNAPITLEENILIQNWPACVINSWQTMVLLLFSMLTAVYQL